MFDDLVLSTMMPYVAIRDIIAVSIAFCISVEDGGYDPLHDDAINAVRHHITVGNIHAAAAVAISSSSTAVISLVINDPAIFFLVEGNACFDLSNVDDFWWFIIQHYRSKHVAESPEMYHHLISTGQWISSVHRHVYASYGVDDYERYYSPSVEDVAANDWHNLISPRHGRLGYSRQKMEKIARHVTKKVVASMYTTHPFPDFLELVTMTSKINPSQSTSDSSHP